VAVEKVQFPPNQPKFGGYKMSRKLRKLFVGHPSAILFLRISREGVFQQPRLITTATLEMDTPRRKLWVVTGMVSFTTPQEAKAFVIGKIVEQAATEGLVLINFERRLLHDTPTEQEIEEFEDRNDGSDALRREREKGGRSSRQEYEQALELFAAEEGDYLAGIIRATVSATISSKVKHGYRKWLLLALVCVVGGLALPLLLMFLMPAIEKAKGGFKASGLGQELHRFLDTYGAIALPPPYSSSGFSQPFHGHGENGNSGNKFADPSP
jgi:hypothetical protein